MKYDFFAMKEHSELCTADSEETFNLHAKGIRCGLLIELAIRQFEDQLSLDLLQHGEHLPGDVVIARDKCELFIDGQDCTARVTLRNSAGDDLAIFALMPEIKFNLIEPTFLASIHAEGTDTNA